jgi:hypothetical protein
MITAHSMDTAAGAELKQSKYRYFLRELNREKSEKRVW